MRTIDMLFLMLTLFNTNLGLSNSFKNNEERKNQESIKNRIDVIDKKLDKILQVMSNE